MFKQAADHIVDNCGKKTLHAVSDLSSAERFKPLCIVERKKSFWPFKKPTMNPTLMRITDMLEDDCDKKGILSLITKREFTLLKQFEESPELDVSGSLSARIASECNLDLKADDKMSLTLKLGDIEKNVVSWDKLHKGLEHAKIDRNDRLYLKAIHAPRISLCVVMETISTKDDGTVEETKSFLVSADANIDVGKTVLVPKIHPKGSVDKKQHHSFTMPSGTVLAYSCVEFSTTPSGVIRLHPVCDLLDDSASDSMATQGDVIDAAQNIPSAINAIKAEFEPLLKSNEFHGFLGKFKALISDVCIEDLQVMDALMHHAHKCIGGTLGEKKILLSTLKNLLGGEMKSTWKETMIHAGFLFPDKTNAESAITLPRSNIKQLNACMGLLDSVIDLGGNALKCLSDINAEHMKILLKVTEDQLEGTDVSLQNQVLQSMIEKNPSTLHFLINCGFLKSSDGKFLTFSLPDKATLLDVYTVLYVLSGTK